MKEIVFLQGEQALTTSLKVAEVFGKRHDRVLRAVENAISTLPKNGDSEIWGLTRLPRRSGDSTF